MFWFITGDMPRAQRVFISYEHSDTALAHRLYEDLKKRGIEVWIDTLTEPGHSTHWTRKTELVAADCVVACLSPQYLADESSRTQLFVARAYDKRILPILVAPFTPEQSPRFHLLAAGQKYTHAIKGLEELDIADFTGNYPVWGLGSYEKNFERLVNVIQPVPKPTPLNSKLIYVSYDWREAEFASRLAKDLELARGRVWIDKLSIPLGSNWRAAMYDGLRKADHFIVCLTAEAATSENVNHEVLVANLRKIPIYPVISERTNREPSLRSELDRALRESTEMKSLVDVKPFVPEPTYEAMLANLEEALGLNKAADSRRDGVFVSYRRADSQAISGRIHERLVDEFGPENVFMDVGNIPPGADFAAYYKKWLASKAAVVIVIIGKSWLSIRDERDPSGPARIQKEADDVRIEVATALGLDDLVVIPVLVDGASMPEQEELPESIRRLRDLQGIAVRHDPDFGSDIGKLIASIRKLRDAESHAQ